ncbi:hypothetical protein [Paenarthrobacter ilicis]|nr:hypothetical protein [Paenarthrobacter ilicis]
MTTAERLAELATHAPHLARKLSLLPPEQLAQILTDKETAS